MKNLKKRVCGHLLLLCTIVTIFGCGSEETAPSSEPLRGVGGGVEMSAGEDQEYTDDGVPIITTDQEAEAQARTQASHTANGELTCTGIFD